MIRILVPTLLALLLAGFAGAQNEPTATPDSRSMEERLTSNELVVQDATLIKPLGDVNPDPKQVDRLVQRALELIHEADPDLVPDANPNSAVHDAVERYRQTGEAVIIKQSGSVLYPFGESQPIVRCSTLRACDIELQAGEAVSGVALGDSNRWLVSPLQSGDPASPTPHVIVKPKDYDLATNIVIATDRRTYHLGLVSPPLDEVQAGELAYHRHVTFYYPADMVEQWATEAELARRRVAATAEANRRQGQHTVSQTSVAYLENLRFEYDVRTRKRGSFLRRLFSRRKPVHFEPAAVFDDGRQVFIRLGPQAREGDLPVLLVRGPGGEPTVVNYRVRDSWFIVDGVFDQAELVLGVGKQRQSVRIERLPDRRSRRRA